MPRVCWSIGSVSYEAEIVKTLWGYRKLMDTLTETPCASVEEARAKTLARAKELNNGKIEMVGQKCVRYASCY